jgi:hypothetical protein
VRTVRACRGCQNHAMSSIRVFSLGENERVDGGDTSEDGESRLLPQHQPDGAEAE